MNSGKHISKEIEKLRSELNKVVLLRGFHHPDALQISQELDIKIVQYIKLIRQDIEEPPDPYSVSPISSLIGALWGAFFMPKYRIY